MTLTTKPARPAGYVDGRGVDLTRVSSIGEKVPAVLSQSARRPKSKCPPSTVRPEAGAPLQLVSAEEELLLEAPRLRRAP